MISQKNRIRDLIPEHYLSDYPKFVVFMEKYYEWLYREGSMSSEERQILIDTPDWLGVDVDKYLKTGQQKNLLTVDEISQQVISEFSSMVPPGTASKNINRNHLLERSFVQMETLDGLSIQDVNGMTVETPNTNPLRIQEWVSDQGYYLPAQAINNKKIDEILFVRLIKSMHLIKGTAKATELFFHLFFNEDIAANNPKDGSPFWKPRVAITTIDDIRHKIDHIDNQIRDDYFYNEFSYVIYVTQDYSHYKDLFENVYLQYIHPAGFKAFLQKV